MKTQWIMGLVAAATLGASAQATEYVVNGGFESSSYASNSQFGPAPFGQGVTGWTGAAGANTLEFYYIGGTQTSVSATNQYGDPKAYFYPSFSTLSPTGGNFVALDGDSGYAGSISQVISGLTVGSTYNLSFDWAGSQLANRTGATTESLLYSLGGTSYSTNVVSDPSGSFSGWMHVSKSFTATSSSETLSFLSVGTPTGLPPIAALDSVSLTGGVPEPAAWALMLMGFGGVGLMVRRVRRKALVAA